MKNKEAIIKKEVANYLDGKKKDLIKNLTRYMNYKYSVDPQPVKFDEDEVEDVIEEVILNILHSI